jgi:hypothetical protein
MILPIDVTQIMFIIIDEQGFYATRSLQLQLIDVIAQPFDRPAFLARSTNTFKPFSFFGL